jgi:ketosteroid isomerase-like protein
MINDIDKLTALNRDFVASVQNSDVRRFDEILAPEFYCSNPDKSLVDRAAFLEQTVKPVAIKNLQAHDVKIRIMGDFAIIHAATSYTTPDGQQACEKAPNRDPLPKSAKAMIFLRKGTC